MLGGNEWKEKARKTKNKMARHSENHKRTCFKHHETVARELTTWRNASADVARGRTRLDGTMRQ